MSQQAGKPRRKLPFNGTWNDTSWKEARRRAINSKDPMCASCHNFIDVSAAIKLADGTLNPLAVEVDHIVPISRGGQPYELDNLQLMHMRCNRKKGSRMADDYVGAEVQNPVPLSNSW